MNLQNEIIRAVVRGLGYQATRRVPPEAAAVLLVLLFLLSLLFGTLK